MDQKILWAVNKMPKTDDKNLPIMGLEEIKKGTYFPRELSSVQRNTINQAASHGFLFRS